jgi:RNA polymerase sigma-70 factor, ECF subfamily
MEYQAVSVGADNSSRTSGQRNAGERELIARILTGQAEEFAQVLECYQDMVFGMIARQVGDAVVAEELAQDVFLRAYRGLGKFRCQASLKTWLTRIALNVCNSYFCSRAYKERRSQVPFADGFDNLPAESGDDCTEEHLQRLQGLAAALKPIHRDVLVLCGFERRSYREAAEILGIPEGTVASRMNKALNVLREKFFASEQ